MVAKFIKSLFIFLLPLTVIFLCVEYLLSDTQTIYTLKRNTLEREADSLQVLVTGTSQAVRSINPALFNRPALNIASPAQVVYYDCGIVLKYLPKLKNLRLVIIPIDYLTLFFDAGKPGTSPLSYYRYWDIDNPCISNTDVRKYSSLAFYQPDGAEKILIKIIEQRKRNIQYEIGNMLQNGYNALDPVADTSELEVKAEEIISRWHERLISANDYPANARRLEELVTVLEAKKIKVLLLTTPVTPHIYKKYDSTLLALKNNFIRGITGKHPAVKFVDFSLDPRFTLKDFHDPNHLDNDGATKFSEIIRREYIDKMIP